MGYHRCVPQMVAYLEILLLVLRLRRSMTRSATAKSTTYSV